MNRTVQTKSAILWAAAFFLTLGAFNLGYSAFFSTPLPATVAVGSGLSATEWNRMSSALQLIENNFSNFSFTAGNVGIGTSPGSKLSVAGTVESLAGGFKFPDATTQDFWFQVVATGTTAVGPSTYATAKTGLPKTEYYQVFMSPAHATTGCGYAYPVWGTDSSGNASMTIWNNSSCSTSYQWKIVRIK